MFSGSARSFSFDMSVNKRQLKGRVAKWAVLPDKNRTALSLSCDSFPEAMLFFLENWINGLMEFSGRQWRDSPKIGQFLIY